MDHCLGLDFTFLTYQDHVYVPWTVHPDIFFFANWKHASA